MPAKQIKTGNSREFKKFTSENLAKALEAVKNGSTFYSASKMFNVPRTTLYRRAIGNYSLDIKKGPPTVLTTEQESYLVEWILHVAKMGFPITNNQLFDSVKQLVEDLKIPNPFKDGRPGRYWLEGFLRRHPSISKRVSQNLTRCRALVTEQKIRDWFTEVGNYLNTQNLMKVFDDPSRVYNCDETAMFLTPQEKSVLAKKGDKTVYAFTANEEKECLTTLFMGNASGTLLPPMIIYKYKRIPQIIAKNMPPGWAIGMSESGWMMSETFFEYIANIFSPWLTKNNITRPVILFLDGHVSHLTLNLSNFCKKNDIILVALLPNSTHMLQPLDVSFFRPLKLLWKNIVRNWRMENNGEKIKKENFAPLLKAFSNETHATNLINGFRGCGLCPFDPNSINYSKYLLNSSLQPIQPIERKQTSSNESKYVQFVEKNIDSIKLANFKATIGDWNGLVEDKNLYLFWKKISTESVEIENETVNIGNTTLENNIYDFDNEELLLNLLGDNDMVTLDIIEEPVITNVIETPLKGDNDMVMLDIIEEPVITDVIEAPFKVTLENNILNIPTPFKRNLFWPEPKIPEQKKISKLKIPAVAVSEQWIDYHEKKKEKKDEAEKVKSEKKKMRQEIIEKKNINKTKKQEEKKPIAEPGPSVRPQQYVIVKYEGEYFPGLVLEVKGSELYVKVMSMSGSNWKWPEKEDLLWYRKEDLVGVINEPVSMNAMGRTYEVKEMKKFRQNL